jgi:hypothetical protein
VRARIERLFGEQPGLSTDIGQRVMSRGAGVLGERPHSLVTVMVPGACMTAGDVFDDVADADADATAEFSGRSCCC